MGIMLFPSYDNASSSNLIINSCSLGKFPHPDSFLQDPNWQLPILHFAWNGYIYSVSLSNSYIHGVQMWIGVSWRDFSFRETFSTLLERMMSQDCLKFLACQPVSVMVFFTKTGKRNWETGRLLYQLHVDCNLYAN